MDLQLFAPLANLVTRRPPISSAPFGHRPVGSVQAGYQTGARAYSRNEIVFSAVEMLATSASEPHILGRRFRRDRPHIRNEEHRLLAAGLPRREVQNRLITNGFFQDLPNHALVQLLEKPNPWMSHGQMWGTVVMDRALAGNSYLLKARVQNGPMKGAIAELWRLRPDRVRIIPSKTNFIEGYEYGTGRDKVTYKPEDIVHFKTRHPLDDYYGMPPLMAAAGRVAIDEDMQTFLRSFYESGGSGPGSILTMKQSLSPEARKEIEDHIRTKFGNVGGPQEWLLLDNTESSYDRVGLERGLRDALPKELDAVSEARIAMVFGIPGSILGLLIGYESSSYANKRQDWQVFWDLTMTPLLDSLDDTLNLQLTPDFGGIDEVLFDLSNIRALQEDVDGIHERHRKDLTSGGESWEEFREATGHDPKDTDGMFLVPSNLVPVSGAVLAGKEPLPVAPARPQIPERVEPEPVAIVAEVRHDCGKLVAKDVMGSPELYCDRCSVKFRPAAW
jgi:HK97 family phage portal protein